MPSFSYFWKPAFMGGSLLSVAAVSLAAVIWPSSSLTGQTGIGIGSSSSSASSRRPFADVAIIIDDSDPRFSTGGGGSEWSTSTSGYKSAQHYHPSTGYNTPWKWAKWHFGSNPPGAYYIYATWSPAGSSSTKVRYQYEWSTAYLGTPTDTSRYISPYVTIGQSTVYQGKQPSGKEYDGVKWQLLGYVTIDNTSQNVVLYAMDVQNGSVAADAAMLLPQGTVWPTCGDTKKDPGEQCDDGNTANGDGCSNQCKTEQCGDGFVDADGPDNAAGNTDDETCDDRNAATGDGCTSGCQKEAGWDCTGSPSVCKTVCGDGLVIGAEKCDDGNTVNGDGCSNACTVEKCGDNVVDADGPDNAAGNVDDEQCDGSGTPKCAAGSACESCRCIRQPACGDGYADSGEECNEPGLSCHASETCVGCACIETTQLCGNGIRESAELCDRTADETTCAAAEMCGVNCTCITCQSADITTTVDMPGSTYIAPDIVRLGDGRAMIAYVRNQEGIVRVVTDNGQTLAVGPEKVFVTLTNVYQQKPPLVLAAIDATHAALGYVGADGKCQVALVTVDGSAVQVGAPSAPLPSYQCASSFSLLATGQTLTLNVRQSQRSRVTVQGAYSPQNGGAIVWGKPKTDDLIGLDGWLDSAPLAGGNTLSVYNVRVVVKRGWWSSFLAQLSGNGTYIGVCPQQQMFMCQGTKLSASADGARIIPLGGNSFAVFAHGSSQSNAWKVYRVTTNGANRPQIEPAVNLTGFSFGSGVRSNPEIATGRFFVDVGGGSNSYNSTSQFARLDVSPDGKVSVHNLSANAFLADRAVMSIGINSQKYNKDVEVALKRSCGTDAATCGDDRVDSGEQCGEPGLYCPSANMDCVDCHCLIMEPPLPGSSSSVARVSCGNGAVETGEQCDDGNKKNGDGCSASCQWENALNCPMISLPSLKNLSYIKSGDLDTDGDLDLVALNSNLPGQGGTTVSVYLNNGNRTFGVRRDYVLDDVYRGLAIGDFDKDGDPDLALAINAFDRQLAIIGNDGTGAFDGSVHVIAAEGSRFYEQLAVGDVNGDGDLDLFAGGLYHGGTVYFGRQGLDFEAGPVLGTKGGNQFHPTLVDVDRDGDLDALGTPGGSDTNVVQVFKNLGDGNFDDAVEYKEPQNPYTNNFLVGDLDDDGYVDLVQQPNGGSLFVWMNDGDGTFTGKLPGQAIGRDGALADFTGDGILDLIGNDYTSPNYNFRKGNGDGTFGENRTLVMAKTGREMVAADFDDNGSMDIAQVMGESGDEVRVMFNVAGCVDQAWGPVCGNGDTDAGEQCGEPGLPACADGQTCQACTCVSAESSSSSVSIATLCGNWVLDDGEGCEVGISCSQTNQVCDVETCRCGTAAAVLFEGNVCGNVRIEPGEDCEDGVTLLQSPCKGAAICNTNTCRCPSGATKYPRGKGNR